MVGITNRHHSLETFSVFVLILARSMKDFAVIVQHIKTIRRFYLIIVIRFLLPSTFSIQAYKTPVLSSVIRYHCTYKQKSKNRDVFEEFLQDWCWINMVWNKKMSFFIYLCIILFCFRPLRNVVASSLNIRIFQVFIKNVLQKFHHHTRLQQSFIWRYHAGWQNLPIQADAGNI